MRTPESRPQGRTLWALTLALMPALLIALLLAGAAEQISTLLQQADRKYAGAG